MRSLCLSHSLTLKVTVAFFLELVWLPGKLAEAALTPLELRRQSAFSDNFLFLVVGRDLDSWLAPDRPGDAAIFVPSCFPGGYRVQITMLHLESDGPSESERECVWVIKTRRN